jgi:hypothetical protein
MKMSSMVGVCSALALCMAAGTAQAGPNAGATKSHVKAHKKIAALTGHKIQAAKAKENLPKRVAGIHKNADGTYKLTTPWYDYHGAGNMQDDVQLCFDALQCDGNGTPIGGTECGLPGDGYRWYWGTTGWLPDSAEDMTLSKDFNGAQATGSSFLYWWTDNGTGQNWYIAVFTSEGFGHNCANDWTNGETVYDGIIFQFAPLTTGFWYTPTFGLDAYGLFFQMPMDGDGGYEFILADSFDGQSLFIAANPAHMGMYGTSEDGGLPNRPGTNTADAFLDGYNTGVPDAVLEDDCVDMAFGLCPDPVANAMSFFAEPSGNQCYPDCDGSGTLDIFDFLCFTNDFNSNGAYSDCDGNNSHDIFDFLCFVNAFNGGC